MYDYFEFAAGLGRTKVFGNGGAFGPEIRGDTPGEHPGRRDVHGVDSACPIARNLRNNGLADPLTTS